MPTKKDLNEREELSKLETGVLSKQDNKLAEFYLKTMFLDIVSKSDKKSYGAEEAMASQYKDSIELLRESMQKEKGSKKLSAKELQTEVENKLGTPQEFMMTFAYTDEIQEIYKKTFSEEYDALQKEIQDRKKLGLMQNAGMQQEDAILTVFKERNPEIQKELEGNKQISKGIQNAMDYLIRNPSSILKGASLVANPGMFAAMKGITALLQTDTGKKFTKGLGDRFTDAMENSKFIQSLKQNSPIITKLAKKFKESKGFKIGVLATVAVGAGVYGLAANEMLPPELMAELPTVSTEGFGEAYDGLKEKMQIGVDVETPTVDANVTPSVDASVPPSEVLDSKLDDVLTYDPVGDAVDKVFPSTDPVLSLDEIAEKEFDSELPLDSLTDEPSGVKLDDALTYNPIGDAVDNVFKDVATVELDPEIMAGAAALGAGTLDITAQVMELAVHEVSSGDTLWDIAEANLPEGATNTDIANYVNDIAEHNKIDNPDLIFPEQKFALPLPNGVNPEHTIGTCDIPVVEETPIVETPIVETPIVETPVVETKPLSILELKNKTWTDLANAGDIVLSDSVNPEKAASIISDNAVAEFKAQNLSRDLGYSRSEMRSIYKEVGENVAESVREKMESAKETGIPMDFKNLEFAVTAKDGTVQTVALSDTSELVITPASSEVINELEIAKIESKMANNGVISKEGVSQENSGFKRPKV
jgi:hypothetical protein